MKHFRKIRRWMRMLMGGGKNEPLRRAVQEGLKLGKDVLLIDVPNFGSEPYLISIGDKTCVSFDVAFINHDAAAAVIGNLPGEDPQTGLFGPITIGKNCFIGCRSTILANVHIGDNVIIGAGSVVNKDIPSNVVAAGVPCRVICTLAEYKDKHKNDFLYMNLFPYEEKKEYLLNVFKQELQ